MLRAPHPFFLLRMTLAAALLGACADTADVPSLRDGSSDALSAHDGQSTSVDARVDGHKPGAGDASQRDAQVDAGSVSDAMMKPDVSKPKPDASLPIPDASAPSPDAARPSPTITDLWNGDARVQTSPMKFGAAFAMHFIKPTWHNGELWTYYITQGSSGPGSFATGLALSSDGVVFHNQGRVLDIGGGWQWTYKDDDLSHQVGRVEGDGWSANTAQDSAGFLAYGPYVSTLPAGRNTASWSLEIDNNTADDLVVVSIDIHDATAGKVLASLDIRRKQFASAKTPQVFNLAYDQVSGNTIEFRTYWHDRAWVRQHVVALSQGSAPFFDQRIASFADVRKVGSTYYMVYEAAGVSAALPGDIGLATSSDGRTWIKHAKRPILKHATTGWEQVNIGTPSLWYENGTWYLFYHGYNGSDVQIGLATGTSLANLSKHPNNPILKVSGGWDAGTLGVRSIVKEGGFYYMVYEGSTDPPYDTASWSSGIARSKDLVNWTKFSGNPVLPATSSGFGNDGPAWVKTPDGLQHIYYRGPGNTTYRATLVWN